MKQSPKGHFYGKTNKTVHLDGLTLTDTVYTHQKVDWHFHENSYFTFLLHGGLVEGNKKEIYECTAGSLLFHNWQEPHYNIKPDIFTKGFHIELEHKWTDRFSFDLCILQGSVQISDPELKLLLYKIFKETRINDSLSMLSIETSLLQVLTNMQQGQESLLKYRPPWVKRINEILHDRCAERLSLTELASHLDIHPVHLSRDFSKYFHCNLGDYTRKLRIEKSLSLLSNKTNSLTGIGFECGFSDQSHFIRCFKQMIGVNPLEYRRILNS